MEAALVKTASRPGEEVLLNALQPPPIHSNQFSQVVVLVQILVNIDPITGIHPCRFLSCSRQRTVFRRQIILLPNVHRMTHVSDSNPGNVIAVRGETEIITLNLYLLGSLQPIRREGGGGCH